MPDTIEEPKLSIELLRSYVEVPKVDVSEMRRAIAQHAVSLRASAAVEDAENPSPMPLSGFAEGEIEEMEEAFETVQGFITYVRECVSNFNDLTKRFDPEGVNGDRWNTDSIPFSGIDWFYHIYEERIFEVYGVELVTLFGIKAIREYQSIDALYASLGLFGQGE